jgi:outer membrane protein assembly factor BamB
MNQMSRLQLRILTVVLALATCIQSSFAEVDVDWPQWRGPRRDGTWRGPKLPERLDAKLPVEWEVAIGGGYAGVIVSAGKCLVFDKVGTKNDSKELERILCFDAKNGKQIWSHEYEQAYGDLAYGNGPRAAPTVYDGRVYSLGALGKLTCLNLKNGKQIWSKDLIADFNGRPPTWGYSASPLVYHSSDSKQIDLLIVVAGGTDQRGVLAFDLKSGELVWKRLDDKAGYSWPVVVKRKSGDQLVYWSPSHIRGLAANTGKLLWSVPYKVAEGVSIATPIVHDNIALVCGYWAGSRAIKLAGTPSNTKLLWEENRYLRGLMSQPLYKDGLVYLLDKQYGITCFELKTGKKLWDDKNQLTPRGRNPQASLCWIGDSDRILALNAEGELILARCNKTGYTEFSRSKIIDPTWAHPAYSGNRIYARSDSKIVCVRLVD